jgi:hypothetical protein
VERCTLLRFTIEPPILHRSSGLAINILRLLKKSSGLKPALPVDDVLL